MALFRRVRLFHRLTGDAVYIAPTDTIWSTLRNLCDNREDRDTRSPLAPDRIPRLYWRWIVAVAAVNEFQLTVADCADLMKCSKGNASRMLDHTRKLLLAELNFQTDTDIANPLDSDLDSDEP